MRIECPKDPKHTLFEVGVSCRTLWTCNEEGQLNSEKDFIGVDRDPDETDVYTCYKCGAEAIVYNDEGFKVEVSNAEPRPLLTTNECYRSLLLHTAKDSVARQLGLLFLGRGDLTTTEIFRNIKGSSALMETLRKILRKKCGWTFEVQDVPGKKIKRYKLVTKEV